MTYIETEFYEVKEVNDKEKFWGSIIHLSVLLSFPFSFLGILFPFGVWIFKKENSDFIDRQGKEAINLSIMIVILNFLSFYIFRSFVSGLFILLVFSFSLYQIIIAYKFAKKGLCYKYLYIYRIIKK